MMNRRSPCLTIWPSLKCTESMNPETRARTSTLSTAAKRPVNSSHSVMTFCTGCATVTAGGGGAELAAGLRSQPTRERVANSSRLKRMPRVIGLARTLKQRRVRQPQDGTRDSHPKTEWEIRQRWRKSQSAELAQILAGHTRALRSVGDRLLYVLCTLLERQTLFDLDGKSAQIAAAT